jgi:type II secretory pathway predicted ATPase ExeA
MVRDPVPDSPPPFTGPAEPANFHCGPAQEEALARLEWLVAERQRCGLVVAAAGMGKSHLVVAAARRLGGLTAEVAILSLGGLPEGEWIDLLLDRLPLDAASRAEPVRPWQKLENRLRENTLLGRPTVLMFDDLDRGPADARSGIARLAAAAEARFATTVIVATATPAGLAAVPEAIRQRAAVRIELFPWSEEEVAAYLADELARAGRHPELLSAAAAATIQRFAAGVPAVVRQLAHLSLAAADSGRLDGVDAGTVETVWRELVPAEADGLHDKHDQHAKQAAELPTGDGDSPRVRVVRRLWG